MRLFQEFYNFFDFLFGTCQSGYVFEGYFDGRSFFKQLGFGFSHAENAASAAHASTAAPAARDVEQEADKECKRKYLPQNSAKIIALFLVADRTVKMRFVLLLLYKVTQTFT